MKPTFVEFDYSSLSDPLNFFLSDGLVIPKHLQKAVEKRQIDFLAGRYCAFRALRDLGITPDNRTLGTDEDRVPIWPEGVVGSITHTKGYGAAIAGSQSHFKGIGIDAELIIDNANDALAKHICIPKELERLSAQSDFNRRELLTLIFSAKESLYKAIYPSQRKFFGFQSAKVTSIDILNNKLSIQLLSTIGSFQKGFTTTISYLFSKDMCQTRCYLP